MVLAALAVLTVALVEFAYQTHLNYRLAVQNKEELQAYYLAKSALNFSKLLLKYNKDAEKAAAEAPPELGNLTSEPFYRLFPLSSDLLRGLVDGKIPTLPDTQTDASDEIQADDSLIERAEKREEAEDRAEENERRAEDMKDSFNAFEKDEAKKFLDFEGDFSLEIIEEQTKFNLNRVATMNQTDKGYDFRKKLLLSILLLPKFKDLFENQVQDAEKLTRALSDWVDANESINDFDGIQRGNESGEYAKEKYEVKNGKFLTLSEIRLVAGMNDEIFAALKPFVTVYGKANSEGINVCYGEDEMLEALVYHFARNSTCASPLEYDDKKIRELADLVKAKCPKVEDMAAALNEALGLAPPTTGTGGGGAPNPGPECAFQFKNLLTKDNNIFTIKGTGTVGETRVTIVNVWNTEGANPDQWRSFYYRIE